MAMGRNMSAWARVVGVDRAHHPRQKVDLAACLRGHGQPESTVVRWAPSAAFPDAAGGGDSVISRPPFWASQLIQSLRTSASTPVAAHGSQPGLPSQPAGARLIRSPPPCRAPCRSGYRSGLPPPMERRTASTAAPAGYPRSGSRSSRRATPPDTGSADKRRAPSSSDEPPAGDGVEEQRPRHNALPPVVRLEAKEDDFALADPRPQQRRLSRRASPARGSSPR